MVLSEQDYECLTKGIAAGVGIGVIVGAILGSVELFFAIGGVIGILTSGIYTLYRRKKSDEK